MKCMVAGHQYILEPFEAGGEGQTIQFIEKVPVEGDPTRLKTLNNGTTNEEVLAMLIDRLNYLFRKMPSPETGTAIARLEDALVQLNQRTRNRIERGVEGTHVA